MNQYLLRYGEIGIKSRNIRRNFEGILIDNIERSFLKNGAEVLVKRERGRLFAHAHEEDSYLFSRIFGLVSYSRVEEVETDYLEMENSVRERADGLEGTFAVRVRRVGDHEFTSQELAAHLGSVALEENPYLEVDLDSPDNIIHVEVRNNRAFFYSDVIKGPGGLPLSSQGKVAAYVEDMEDFLATWLMMRRGARAYVFSAPDSTVKRLEGWDPNLKTMGEGDIDDMLNISFPPGIRGIVVGDRLGDLRKIEHSLPIYRPLVGFTDERVEEYMGLVSELEKGR